MAGLSEEQSDIIKNAAAKYFPELIQKTRESNRESRDVLLKQGVTFEKTTAEIITTLERHRDNAIARVRGKSFSEEAYQIVQSALNPVSCQRELIVVTQRNSWSSRLKAFATRIEKIEQGVVTLILSLIIVLAPLQIGIRWFGFGRASLDRSAAEILRIMGGIPWCSPGNPRAPSTFLLMPSTTCCRKR